MLLATACCHQQGPQCLHQVSRSEAPARNKLHRTLHHESCTRGKLWSALISTDRTRSAPMSVPQCSSACVCVTSPWVTVTVEQVHAARASLARPPCSTCNLNNNYYRGIVIPELARVCLITLWSSVRSGSRLLGFCPVDKLWHLWCIKELPVLRQ